MYSLRNPLNQRLVTCVGAYYFILTQILYQPTYLPVSRVIPETRLL